jgi:hypothetical protein
VHDRAYGVEVARRHQDHDLVDQWRRLERRDGVLDDRLAGDLDELLGDRQTDPRTGATGQDDGHVAEFSHPTRLPSAQD